MKISEIEKHHISIVPSRVIDGRVDNFVELRETKGNFKIIKNVDGYHVHSTLTSETISLKNKRLLVLQEVEIEDD